MGEVVGKGFLVENTGAHQRAILPSSKCAADSWDGGEVLADADALIFSLKLILKHDIWFVATALGAGNLCIQKQLLENILIPQVRVPGHREVSKSRYHALKGGARAQQ